MDNIKQKFLLGSILFSTFLPVSGFAASSAQCEGLKAVSPGAQCGTAPLTSRLNAIIDTLFIVIGAVAVIIMVIGGIRYITSTGDSKRIQAAKDTILYAVFGLIVTILARAIVQFVVVQVG